jgi:hypothetical protein
MRRSRSHVFHSAHGSAYAAGQQHSPPSHTRKVAGSTEIFHRNLAADQASILNAFQALDDYLEDMIARRRRTLTDDLISELIRGEDDGEQLNHDELLSLAVALLGTGTDIPHHQRPPVARCCRRHAQLIQVPATVPLGTAFGSHVMRGRERPARL